MPVMLLLKQHQIGTPLKQQRKKVRFYMASTLLIASFSHIEGVASFIWPNYYVLTAIKVGVALWVGYVAIIFPTLVGQIEAERKKEWNALKLKERTLAEFSEAMIKEIASYTQPGLPAKRDDQA
jgi:hypothetical protein